MVGAWSDTTGAGAGGGSAYVFTRSGSSWSAPAHLLAPDAAAGDQFAWSVAVSGDTAVVGSPLDDTAAGADGGSAYVFVRSGTSWSEEAHLFAPDAAGVDEFTFSVAVVGDTAVVGSPLDDTAAGGNAGSAYVFVRSGSSWSEQAHLVASDAAVSDIFGVSVALSGTTAVVGANFDDTAGGADAGSAFVFGTVPPTLSIGDVTQAEGDAGTTTFTFTVTRSGDTAAPASVQWSTADGSAAAPGDYTAVGTTTLSFAAGETSKTVSVDVVGDTAVEANDGFTVSLANSVGATITDGTGVGRITNDDVASFSVDDVTVTEGNSGPKTATFTVTRTGASGGPASDTWSTLDAQAKAPGDYAAVASTLLSFGPGETSKTVAVTVNGDSAVEPAEAFYLRLRTPVGATIADANGVGTITNDDPLLNAFSVSDATVAEGDAATTTATFTISRTGNTTAPASVSWFTQPGTATAGTDYLDVAPTVSSFAGGETSMCR